jgi:hypothetical protein
VRQYERAIYLLFVEHATNITSGLFFAIRHHLDLL